MSPSLCCSTSGTRRRKTFIMLANSMPSTASARQASRKASRRTPASSAISVYLRDAVQHARLDPAVELVRATEAVQQIPEHGELGPVLAERRLLGGQLRRGEVDPRPERVRGLLDGRGREPVAVAPRARPGGMVHEVGEHEDALGQYVHGLEGVQGVDHEVARVRVVEVDVVGVRYHDHARPEGAQLAAHERGEVLPVVLGALGGRRAVLLGVGRGVGAGARPVILPELCQPAIGEAEEDEVAAMEPQVAGRGDRLPPPHLPELEVVGVARLSLVEVLRHRLRVAVAVGDEHDAHRGAAAGEAEDQAAGADRLVVGVRGDDEHARTRGDDERRTPRAGAGRDGPQGRGGGEEDAQERREARAGPRETARGLQAFGDDVLESTLHARRGQAHVAAPGLAGNPYRNTIYIDRPWLLATSRWRNTGRWPSSARRCGASTPSAPRRRARPGSSPSSTGSCSRSAACPAAPRRRSACSPRGSASGTTAPSSWSIAWRRAAWSGERAARATAAGSWCDSPRTGGRSCCG